MKKAWVLVAWLAGGSAMLTASCSPQAPPSPPPPPPLETVRPERPAVELLRFEAPASWKKGTPASKLRKAQYAVPDKEKQANDAELVIFYFGPSNAMLQENLDRWAGQVGASDPKPQVLQGKLKITLVDLEGTYTGDDAGSQPNSRLLAAVVEAPEGPWYFKLVGPADTVGDWRDDFVSMLKAAGQ